MRKFAFLSATAVALAIFVVSIIGINGARADSHATAVAGIVGHGTVATETSELTRGLKFRLKARVYNDGSARGEFVARIYLRHRGRVIGVDARFSEGTIHGNGARLAGKATIHKANGETIAEVPIRLGVKVEGPGEYKMVLEIGGRVLEGEGVSGDVTIFREIPIGTTLRDAISAK